MKKYTVDEMLNMERCHGIKCNQCPFELEEYDKKYNTDCKALIYCLDNNIDRNEYWRNASEYYINYLKEERKLLLQDIMEL